MIRLTLASNCSRVMLDSKLDRASALRRRGRRSRNGLAQPAARTRSIDSDGAGVRGLDVSLVVDERVREQRQLVALVVEDHQRLGDHQRHVRQPERVGVRLAERLDGSHEVVAEEADGAAGERRQALDRRRAGTAPGTRATARVGIGRSRSSRSPRSAARRRHPSTRRALPVCPAQHRTRRGSRGTSSAPAAPARPTRAGSAGPPPRSLRNAETGVSVSSTKRQPRPGSALRSRASSRARSRSGSSSSSALSGDGH